MRVLVLSTAPPDRTDPSREIVEFDLSAAARGVAAVIPGAIAAETDGAPAEVVALLEQHRPDIVYNLCEAPFGRPDLEAHIAALFEWAGVRFTGSRSETLALCRRKDRTAAVLAAAGVAAPRRDGFPCIVKPADEDGSAFIDRESICANAGAVARARARISGRVVVERFLPGREFSVALWGRNGPEHVSIGETCFRGDLRLITYAAKWDRGSRDDCESPLCYDSPLDAALRDAIVGAASGAWRAVEARGYLSVDVRLDDEGIPHVIDVNPNPDCTPSHGMHRAVSEAGWTWERFVHAQLEWA